MNADARPLVSVIIVNWNTRDLLRACLASLPYGSSAVRLEVIVVDNGSTDGSAEMVRAEYARGLLLRNDANLGFTRATNQALRRASGEFLFLLNSDTEVRPGCIERLVAVAASDERIGAAGPRLLNPDGSHQVSSGPFPRLVHRLLPSRFERRYERRLQARMQARGDWTATVDWLSGAALLFRRDVLEAVGPLDERYFMWYEDLDWAQRLQRAGYARVFVGDAVVVHYGRQSGAQVADRELAAQLFDSEYTYVRLHSGRVGTALVFALRIAKALVRQACGGPQARADAASRLAYHVRCFRRFCWARWPAPGRTAPGPAAVDERQPR
jgi:N-acetylglucosaminyl-diphospho-decaprenol L-rhamnosyltransferase